MPEPDAFERAYIERAREWLGRRDVEAIWPGRDAPSDAGGLLVAGWWCDPAPGGRLVVLPNPWDERAAVASMERRCWEAAQATLAVLAPVLDDLHGTRRGRRYWDMVLAPWAVHVVSAVADRQLFLAAAQAVAPGRPVLGPPAGTPPATMGAASSALRTPETSSALIARMAAVMGLEVEPAGDDPPPPVRPIPQPSARARVAGVLRTPHVGRVAALVLLRTVLNAAPGPRVSVLGISGLDAPDAARLARRVRGLRLPRTVGFPAPVPAADAERRARLAAPDAVAGTLECLVAMLLPDLLPRTVLEGYPALCAASAETYGEPSPVLACNYAADEVQNEFLARCVAAGHRLAFAQHGGFYLQAEVNAQERLELREGCEFWSWGRSSPQAVQVPSPRVERLRSTHRGGAVITLVEGVHPPDTYLLRFASTPLGNQVLDAPERLARFVEAAPANVRRSMRLKRYPAVIGAAPRSSALGSLSSAGPPGAATAAEWMQRSKLAVVSYPDTPFLEALVIGVPTVGLWNAGHWEWRAELQNAIAALESARVIFSDPVAAAAHVGDVLGDVDAWWSDAATVAARTAFVDALAPPGDWLAGWTAGLRRLRAPTT